MKKMFSGCFIFLLLVNCFIGSPDVSAGTGAELSASAGAAAGAAVKGAPVAALKDAGYQAAEKIAPAATSSIGDFFASSQGVALLSGISTVYSGVLYNAAAQQEEESKDNIKKIDRIIAEFKDSFISFCPNGREDLNVPDCYCYLSDGKQNPDRTKSQICQALWAKNSYKLSAKAGDYGGISKFVDPVGCLTVSGQFDEDCKCKKFTDSKGNNACAKGVSINIPNNSFGSALLSNTGLKEVGRFAAGSVTGDPNFNSFNAGGLALRAIQNKSFRDNLVTRLASAATSGIPGLKQINENNVRQIAKAALSEKGFDSVTGANNSSAMAAVSSGAPVDPKLASSLKAAASKAGINFDGSGRGLTNRKAESKEQFAFNVGGEAAQNNAGQSQDFPEEPKNYKIKSDISKQPDTSIFEIISNRYIQSGLKRLFDDK